MSYFRLFLFLMVCSSIPTSTASLHFYSSHLVPGRWRCLYLDWIRGKWYLRFSPECHSRWVWQSSPLTQTRNAHGGFTLFLLRRHLENTLCRSGSRPPPRGCDIIKGEIMQCPGSVWRNLICATAFASFLPRLALAECLQCVPDESPRAARAKRGEGDPWSARSGRLGGRKGTSHSCKTCLSDHDYFLLGLIVKYCECMCSYTRIDWVFLSHAGRSRYKRSYG